MAYKIIRIVDASDVPDWERRPPKWTDLVDKVLSLEPNQTLEIEFDDATVAERARNAVRDMANLRAKSVAIRTRVVQKEEKGATLFLTRTVPIKRT